MVICYSRLSLDIIELLWNSSKGLSTNYLMLYNADIYLILEYMLFNVS